MQFPKLETASAPSFPSFTSVRPQENAVAREYARDSFTAAPAVSRPRIDLG